jgi:hypothetical protein
MKFREIKLRVAEYFIHEHENFIYRFKSNKVELCSCKHPMWKRESYLRGYGQPEPSTQERRENVIAHGWKIVSEQEAMKHLEAIAALHAKQQAERDAVYQAMKKGQKGQVGVADASEVYGGGVIHSIPPQAVPVYYASVPLESKQESAVYHGAESYKNTGYAEKAYQPSEPYRTDSNSDKGEVSDHVKPIRNRSRRGVGGQVNVVAYGGGGKNSMGDTWLPKPYSPESKSNIPNNVIIEETEDQPVFESKSESPVATKVTSPFMFFKESEVVTLEPKNSDLTRWERDDEIDLSTP